MRHRSCGSLAWTGVSGLSHQLSPADTHTSRRCGVSPEIPRTPIHTIRSAVRRSEHPSCSPLAIAARSCTVNIRRTNNPLPDKHCCYDPMTPQANSNHTTGTSLRLPRTGQGSNRNCRCSYHRCFRGEEGRWHGGHHGSDLHGHHQR